MSTYVSCVSNDICLAPRGNTARKGACKLLVAEGKKIFHFCQHGLWPTVFVARLQDSPLRPDCVRQRWAECEIFSPSSVLIRWNWIRSSPVSQTTCCRDHWIHKIQTDMNSQNSNGLILLRKKMLRGKFPLYVRMQTGMIAVPSNTAFSFQSNK